MELLHRLGVDPLSLALLDGLHLRVRRRGKQLPGKLSERKALAIVAMLWRPRALFSQDPQRCGEGPWG